MPGSVQFQFDMTKLQKAVRFVQEVAPQDTVVLTNKAALQTIIGSKGHQGAIQLTPRASRAAIKAVSVRQVAAAVIARAKRKGEWPLKGDEIKRRIKAEYARRVKSIAYTAGPGWNKAAQALGGRGVAGVQPGFTSSEASKGYAVPAAGEDFSALIVNTAPAADKIGRAALQQALDNEAADLIEYGERKLQQTFDAA